MIKRILAGQAWRPLGRPLFTRRERPLKHADELKSSGLKATLPRIKILEIFQRSEASAHDGRRRLQGPA